MPTKYRDTGLDRIYRTSRPVRHPWRVSAYDAAGKLVGSEHDTLPQAEAWLLKFQRERDMTEIEKVGVHAALTALDQADDMGGLEQSIDSYFINLGDTLTEMGARDKGDEARRGFEHVLLDKGVTYRPHGL